MKPSSSTETIDLDDVLVDSGADVSEWVDRIRAMAKAHRVVRVRHCPQMIAHTLYKAGLLRSGAIVLEDVRFEEPYG